MPFRKRAAAALLVLTLSCGAAGCGSNSKNNPTGPGSNSAAGTWTGTLNRPGGLAPMSVRWEAQVQEGQGLIGPMTLTNAGVSVTITGKGSTAGNDSSGYNIHMQLSSNSGDIPGFPNCAVRGNTSGSGQGDPFTQPYRTISVPNLDISYAGCAGFVEIQGLSNFVQEKASLSLTK